MVVAGYYDAVPQTGFESAVVPYVLVMPDQVNPNTFLPATRSMMIEKMAWQNAGRFSEKLSWNEDYEFALRLQKKGISIFFAGQAKVSWIPVSNLQKFWKMIWRFAKGDIQAKIWRGKVKLIFIRYILALLIVGGLIFIGQIELATLLCLLGLGAYSIWAVIKNERYVVKGKMWLPVLQFTSDLAVMGGSLAGLVN